MLILEIFKKVYRNILWKKYILRFKTFLRKFLKLYCDKNKIFCFKKGSKILLW